MSKQSVDRRRYLVAIILGAVVALCVTMCETMIIDQLV
jgi:hypothetical protein